MSRGRKPRSTATHKRVGSFRHDRHAKRADVKLAPVKNREVPKWLSPMAKKCWPEIMQLLEACGYMADQHRPGLALLCDAIADHVTLSQAIQKLKPSQRLKAYIQKAKSMDVLKGMLREFGMTPASVASIKIKNGEEKKADTKGDKFFNGPRLAEPTREVLAVG